MVFWVLTMVVPQCKTWWQLCSPMRTGVALTARSLRFTVHSKDDCLVNVQVVGYFRIFSGNLDVYYHFELSHGGQNVRLTESSHLWIVGLIFHRKALAPEIETNDNYRVVSLDPYTEHAGTDLEI